MPDRPILAYNRRHIGPGSTRDYRATVDDVPCVPDQGCPHNRCAIGDHIEKEFTVNIRQKIQAAICTAVVAFACMTISPATSAQVAVSGALCTGIGNQTYTPAVTLAPQNIAFSASGNFSCLTTSESAMTGGSFTVSGQGTYSCLGVSSFIGQLQLNWTDASGQVLATSEAPLNSLGVTIPVGSMLAAKGDIATGPFQANHASVFLPQLTIELAGCLTGGMRHTAAPLVLGISSAI
jgi:hypothetical protein